MAQLGGAHVACEWVSNVVTKLLQRGRLASYLEQSTRYIAYDSPLPAAATATGATPRSGPSTSAAMDGLFDDLRREPARASSAGPPSASRAARASPRPPTGAR